LASLKHRSAPAAALSGHKSLRLGGAKPAWLHIGVKRHPELQGVSFSCCLTKGSGLNFKVLRLYACRPAHTDLEKPLSRSK
jgi:hypothetical protein